jgi:hypothetical protein
MGRPQFSLVPELTLDEVAGYHGMTSHMYICWRAKLLLRLI